MLGFGGTIPTSKLLVVLFSAYGLEMIYALIFVWPGWAIANFLKKSEGLDVYDCDINYNPFKFT